MKWGHNFQDKITILWLHKSVKDKCISRLQSLLISMNIWCYFNRKKQVFLSFLCFLLTHILKVFPHFLTDFNKLGNIHRACNFLDCCLQLLIISCYFRRFSTILNNIYRIKTAFNISWQSLKSFWHFEINSNIW